MTRESVPVVICSRWVTDFYCTSLGCTGAYRAAVVEALAGGGAAADVAITNNDKYKTDVDYNQALKHQQ